jgi:hypothetical protein
MYTPSVERAAGGGAAGGYEYGKLGGKHMENRSAIGQHIARATTNPIM